MKKKVITISAFLLIFFVGIWIGKTKFQINSNSDEPNIVKIDTAQINAEREYENEFPTYTVQGGMMQPEDKYRYIIDRWYGFRFVVNGNTCTDPNNMNIDLNHNNRTDSILKKRIGKNWYEKFEKSVDSLYSLDTLAVFIVRNNIQVKNLIKKKSKNKDRYTSYKCYSTNKGNLKIVSLEWEDIIYKDSINVSFARVIIDIKEKRVKGIEQSEMEWNPYR